MTEIATIYDTNANIIADGLQPAARCNEAIQRARDIAKESNRRVILKDSDGWWIVGPRGKPSRFTARHQKFGGMVTA